MERVLVTEQYLSEIGSAIREKNGQSSIYTPSQMASAIRSIRSAGDLSIISKAVFSNGTYVPLSDQADAFSSVIVSVPNTYNEGDEGKVVSLSSLVQQGRGSIVSNGLYDTTMISSVSVAIPDAVLINKVISENGTYDAANDGVDGFSQVTVNVAGSGGGIDAKIVTREAGSIFDNVVSRVGQSALAYYSGLSAVEMTEVTRIENYGFVSCSKMSYASFPKCSYVGQYAFRYCSSLSTIILKEGVELGIYAFESCGLINFDFNTISSIPNGAFAYNKLSEVIAPICSQVYNYAFQSCYSLSIVSMDTCNRIHSVAFGDCSNLSIVYCPEVQQIGSSAFSYCRNITKLSFPKCSDIGGYAFAYCSKLESLYLLSTSMCRMPYTALNNTPMSNSTYLGHFGSIYVPSELLETYRNDTNWSRYSDRITAYVEE